MNKTKNMLMKGFGAVLACSSLLAMPAQAELMLELSDGTETVSVSEIGNSGSTLFVGAVGGWVLNITTGVSDPLIGEENVSRLALNSINITGSSQSGGTLTIRLTDTDYTAPVGDTHFSFDVGGVSDGDISFRSYVDSSNTAFGTGTLLYDSSSYSGAFSGGGYGAVSVSGPYSITTVATINHEHGYSLTGFSHVVQVPEPASLALLGMGLLSIAFVIRRSKKRR